MHRLCFRILIAKGRSMIGKAFHNFTTRLKKTKLMWLLENWGKIHFNLHCEDDLVQLVVNFTKEKMLKCSSGYLKQLIRNMMSISSNHKESGNRFVLISLDFVIWSNHSE